MTTWAALPSLHILANVAFGGAILISTTVIVIEHQFQKKVRETSTYIRVLDIFRSNEKAVKYLGEPIKEGKVKIINNKVGDVKKFTIDMKGSNTKGRLDCEYKVMGDHKTEIQKIDLAFKDIPDKIYTLHKI